ncbi:MAG: hypothetical protein M3406_10185 [Chloroflexota bacterium]|nr:hypothetical protein [Chloroflexota bacterium]
MHSPQPAAASRWATALRGAWPVGLVIVLATAILGDGFNPTDEGLIAATSQRLLDGQVPHLDFITPRTAASAYLHLPELLLPTPLFLTGRLVAVVEVMLYSLLLAWLVLGQAPWHWGLGAILGVAASTLINLNTVPLMPWYTTDGLLLASLGLVLLRAGLVRDRRLLIALGFASLALSAMAKQSFAPVLVIGFVWLVAASSPAARPRRIALALVAAAMPVVLYSASVALGGGWPAMVQQLLSSRPTLGEELLAPLGSPGSVLLLVAVPVALAWVNRSPLCGEPAATGRAGVVAAVALTVLVMTILLTSGLRVTAYWGILLTWLLAAYVAGALLFNRRLDGTAFILVLLAWMTSLSYGVPVPSLVAGSAALALIERAWRHVPELSVPRPMAAASVAFGLLFLTIVPAFAIARSEYVHRDAPRAELTADLGALSPALAGIRTNERTATYLRVMRECVEAHPAVSVAVLPDNPAVYPAFGWSNPLPLDFLYPPEYEGVRDEVLQSTQNLAQRGDYLVVFQRVRADTLLDLGIDLTGGGAPHTYDAELTAEMRDVLAANGDQVTCGVFDGYHAPSR